MVLPPWAPRVLVGYRHEIFNHFNPKLFSKVNQAIMSKGKQVVMIRLRHDWDSQCMQMDGILHKIADIVEVLLKCTTL